MGFGSRLKVRRSTDCFLEISCIYLPGSAQTHGSRYVPIYAFQILGRL